MPAYFADFQEALDPSEATGPATVKAPDTGGDVLPFGHLDDRRFEMLVYRLKYVELSSTGHRVTLMQGVGERGRDVIVHSPSGMLTQIIQCKKYGDKFTAPSLRKELLKLALHHYLDSSILGAGPVAYELWCPGGLTEPAAKLLDTWPNGWSAAALQEDALEVLESYAAFRRLNWPLVEDRIVADFQRVISPRHITGVDISVRARHCLPVYETYFQGKIVMDRADVLEAVRQIAAEATGFAQLNDGDAKHLLDRIAFFPAERRFVHMSGYVMGLEPELVSRFNRNEYESFAKHAIQGTIGILQVLVRACARLGDDASLEFRESVKPTNPNVTQVFAKTLTLSVVARINGMMVTGLKLQPGLEAYARLSLRERLQQHARELWEEYQRCLERYNPKEHSYGSDEEFRARIALHAIDSARDRDEFEGRLMLALDLHTAEIETKFTGFMRLVPEELLLITDTMTVFENEWLFRRMTESVNVLERLRGSPDIPE